MPIFAPRKETIKKEEQLFQRQFELQQAIKRNIEIYKINKLAHKLRLAHLSLLKATIHIIKEKEFQKKSHNYNIEKIEKEIEIWENKTVEGIISEIKMID